MRATVADGTSEIANRSIAYSIVGQTQRIERNAKQVAVRRNRQSHDASGQHSRDRLDERGCRAVAPSATGSGPVAATRKYRSMSGDTTSRGGSVSVNAESLVTTIAVVGAPATPSVEHDECLVTRHPLAHVIEADDTAPTCGIRRNSASAADESVIRAIVRSVALAISRARTLSMKRNADATRPPATSPATSSGYDSLSSAPIASHLRQTRAKVAVVHSTTAARDRGRDERDGAVDRGVALLANGNLRLEHRERDREQHRRVRGAPSDTDDARVPTRESAESKIAAEHREAREMDRQLGLPSGVRRRAPQPRGRVQTQLRAVESPSTHLGEREKAPATRAS